MPSSYSEKVVELPVLTRSFWLQNLLLFKDNSLTISSCEVSQNKCNSECTDWGKTDKNSFLYLLAFSTWICGWICISSHGFSLPSELFIFLCKSLKTEENLRVSLCGFLFEFQRTPQLRITHLHLEGKAKIVPSVDKKPRDPSSFIAPTASKWWSESRNGKHIS